MAVAALTRYLVHEILNSSFVTSQWKVVSPHHLRRHFVITFQDSTFECVATDCVLAGIYGLDDVASEEAFIRFP